MTSISLLLPDLRGGGAERVQLDLAREFLARGHRVEFALMRVTGELLPEVPPECRIVDLKAPRIRDLWPALHRYFRTVDADAILAAMWPLTGIACLAKRTSGSRASLVVSEHVDFQQTPSFKSIERILLKVAGRIIYGPAAKVVAVSAGVAESIKACTGLSPDRIVVVYNPIRQPSSAPLPSTDRALFDWWSGGRKVIAIGTLKRQKGFDILLRAISSVKEARLIILGEGDLRQDLERLTVTLGIVERCRLPGFRPDPFPLLRSADLFVLSSRWEGLGNVIVEALACGVPVVSAECMSGPREILEGGRFGKLVPPENSEALADAIRGALSATHDIGVLTLRARDFTSEIAAVKYSEIMLEKGD